MQFQRGQIMTVKTTELAPGGAALGKLPDGRSVFVRGGAPNEEAAIRLTRIKKDFAEGELVEVIEASVDRVIPDFPAAALAGADWSHLRYTAQLAAKQRIVGELLTKIGQLDNFSLEEIVGAPDKNQWRYRNKVELTFGLTESDQVTLGFHAPGRFDAIIPTDDIALFPVVGRQIIDVIKRWANDNQLSVFEPRSKKGLLRNLVIRRAEHGTDLLINLVTSPGKIPIDSLLSAVRSLPFSGLIWTENAALATIVRADTTHRLLGSEYIEENFLGMTIRYRADSFFQTHTTMAEKLAENLFSRWHPAGANLIDGYAGVGGFGLLAARAGANVVSIESHEGSIVDARANAQRLGVANQMEFIHAPMEQWLKSQDAKRKIQNAVLIVDPPRAGLHPKALKAIADSGICRMFYVSCNPATLARDLSLFSLHNSSLSPIYIQPFDLFPQTSHIETLVELVRNP